ncbi:MULTISPECIES: hypothetical protein [Nonomuraea]|uniref:Uncharacterized protein n=2 Tax=Nonomuraea TaxID=83681 RepID=A0A7W5V353_9ACTN|nr:hypothetical protein [Nonomuraea dietziae]MBB3728084.1 hypothetical protein [Nonomuraea dietziae]
MIPEREQIGSVDLTTWRVVPADGNPDKDEHGAWAIAGGDSDEYDLYLEVREADRPREVARFVVEAVTRHARGLRLKGALADVAHVRDRQPADDERAPSNPSLPDVTKLAHLVEAVGGLAHEVSQAVPRDERGAYQDRLYGQLAQVAATTVAWMEAVLSERTPDPDAGPVGA